MQPTDQPPCGVWLSHYWPRQPHIPVILTTSETACQHANIPQAQANASNSHDVEPLAINCQRPDPTHRQNPPKEAPDWARQELKLTIWSP